MKNSLDFYKTSKDMYEYGHALIAYTCIEAALENATDEEYLTIFNACYYAYMKAEDSNWVNLVEGVAGKYADKKFTLNELKSMDKWDLLEMEIHK